MGRLDCMLHRACVLDDSQWATPRSATAASLFGSHERACKGFLTCRDALQFRSVSEACGMTAEFLPDNPYDTLSEGCDFARNHMPDCIDFATIHLWPDTWLAGAGGQQCGEEGALRFARRWINAHVDCCARLGKPLVLTEFGKKPAGPPRAAFYQKVCTDAPFRMPAGLPLLKKHDLLMSAPNQGSLSCAIPQRGAALPAPAPLPYEALSSHPRQSSCKERRAVRMACLQTERLQHRPALHRWATLPLAMPCAEGLWLGSCCGWWQPAPIPTMTATPAAFPALKSPADPPRKIGTLCRSCYTLLSAFWRSLETPSFQ